VRILIPSLPSDVASIELTGAELHYLSRVRRAAPGTRVILFDGQGRQAEAVVDAITATAARLTVGEVHLAPDSGPEILSIIPMIKGDRMDLCVEKLVEVGTSAIVLFEAERAVVRLPAARRAARRDRFRQLARAACRQSGRSHEVEIHGPIPLPEVAALTHDVGLRLICLPGAASVALPQPLPTRIAVLTGPEGGFSPTELAWAEATGFAPMGLGAQVLRAETAPVIAVGHLRIVSQIGR
jgi:16S rRNA (uracil1498-N3)-methyltransferase